MPTLNDYSLIGNCRTAALVNKTGSIDWCCFPGFDSPAIFSYIIDKISGGYFSIQPKDYYESYQQYITDTNVVQTFFRSSGGSVVLTDAFTAQHEISKSANLFPDHEILRVVECISGRVEMKMEFHPTVFYGKFKPRLENKNIHGISFNWKENSYHLLCSNDEIKIDSDNYTAASFFNLSAGEKIIFSLSCSSQAPAILPEIKITGWQRIEETINYWKEWTSQCNYDGIYKNEVIRSVLTLKLLSFAPSGAIIAAPTTSLPECIGGSRNWDYRYCWLRDASFTIRVLINLGYKDEAHAYMNWILHATQLTRPRLQVVYSCFGHARLKESILDWMEGYKNSRPVRIGNGAYNQHQLDVYGEVLDAIYCYSAIVEEFDNNSKRFINGLGKEICRLWKDKDQGIWEMRSNGDHYTHSKVMAWVGLDRLICIAEKYKWKNSHIENFRKVREAIKEQVENSGFNKELNSYTSTLNGSELDASSLVFSLVGYCEAGSKRMQSTLKAINEKLAHNGFLYRYINQDGLKDKEGSFGICNFWLAENFAQAGKIDEARDVFEKIVTHASPTGLMAEEIDPVNFEQLGNYPQGFTHIGLINAAISINEAMKKTNLFS